jgi:sortase (surface protein transpeptidase)
MTRSPELQTAGKRPARWHERLADSLRVRYAHLAPTLRARLTRSSRDTDASLAVLNPPALVQDTRPMSQALPSIDRKSRTTLGGLLLVTGGILIVTFALHLFAISQVYNVKQQTVLFNDFRYALANATAPVGQVDQNDRILLAGTPVALIEIPKIGMTAVVVEGTSPEAMLSGPGHRRDTPLPGQLGNSVVFGRQFTYGGTFAHIGSLAKGDKFSVVTGQGEHAYVVDRVRYTGDPIPTFSETGSFLTLVSASGIPLMPSSVVRVDAHLTSPVAETPAQMFSVETLPESELAMYGDADAWGLLALEFLVMGILFIVFWLSARFWGSRQTWIVAVPVALVFAIATSVQASFLLPNLL